MPANALPETRRVSTQDIPLEQRLAFWEDYNASTLVGLKCLSYSQAGFATTQNNPYLERLRPARIDGNEHVMECDRSMVHAVPKEPIFASLVQGSQSFFYQDSSCNLLQPGELAIYRINKPYLPSLFGSMRQFIFNTPQDDFTGCCLHDFKGPLRIGTESPVQRLLTRTLGKRARDFLDSPRGENAERYRGEAYDLLASITSDHVGEYRANALGVSYLLAVKQYIQRHLDEPALSRKRMAAATGASSQHLARLFAQEGSSPGHYLQERRLERACQLLASPQGRCPDVVKVVHRHSFSSQVYFTRTFKMRYGVIPSEAHGRQARLPYLSFSYYQGPVP